MDLTLSRTADYAVRAAIALAEAFDSDGYLTIEEISREMALPRTYTPQVVGLLIRAGVAVSRAGRGGGYRLARPAREVRLLEVVEAAEGPLGSERCVLRGGPCRWDDACAVHPTFASAAERYRASLSRATLAHLAAEDRRLLRRGR